MSPCASQEQLKRFLRDRLADPERDIVADHLDECTSCQDFLDRITGALQLTNPCHPSPNKPGKTLRLLELLKAEGPRRHELAEPSEPPANPGWSRRRGPRLAPARSVTPRCLAATKLLPVVRRLPDHPRDRPRRYGCGLRGRGRTAEPPRCAQGLAHEPAHAIQADSAVRTRSPCGGPVAPYEHCARVWSR